MGFIRVDKSYQKRNNHPTDKDYYANKRKHTRIVVSDNMTLSDRKKLESMRLANRILGKGPSEIGPTQQTEKSVVDDWGTV